MSDIGGKTEKKPNRDCLYAIVYKSVTCI